jgi:Elongation factor G, domain IV
MTIRSHYMTIHERELRALVLEAIPSLGDGLGDEERADPHQVMCALFHHATRAIRNEDISAVIRCFRLTRELVELDGECDIFVTSAIWASYLHRFQRHDPLALKIFRAIDPQVRETLYSPFTFPHTWLREVTIRLSGADRWHKWVTVDRQVEAEARLIRQVTCCGHFAVVRLRLEPMLQDRSVLFRNCLDDSHDAPLMYLDDVVEGVTRALAERSGADRGVSYLRISLLGLGHHPVDSRRFDFVALARQAVERCIAEAGLAEI